MKPKRKNEPLAPLPVPVPHADSHPPRFSVQCQRDHALGFFVFLYVHEILRNIQAGKPHYCTINDALFTKSAVCDAQIIRKCVLGAHFYVQYFVQG